MLSITIITIVVVAVLTAIIFLLAWIGFSALTRAYKVEIDHGEHDTEIFNKFYNLTKKDRKKQIGIKIITYIIVFLLLILLLFVFIVGIIYNSTNYLSMNDKTALVIKTGSMSSFYDKELEEKYIKLGYSKNLQFSVGDICIFEKSDDELILGQVYGYKYNNIIITHRLIDTYDITDDNGKIIQTYYIFRGDNNPDKDQVLVSKDNIIYHYIGTKIPILGSFILYAQSYFGIWSLISICGIILTYDVFTRKINKMYKERANILGGKNNEK